MSRSPFHLWAFSCAHVGTDQHCEGRESLADALRQSESDTGFDWHVALNLGDHSGSQGEPDDEEGREIVRQYAVLRDHRREQIYDIGGNHDRSDVGKPEGWWFDKWIDPTGTHTRDSGVNAAKRSYPIDGDWERYAFRVGNLLFLMMSDRNEPACHLPRTEGGRNPGGVVSTQTFAWWKEHVEANRDAIIVSCHHYMLKVTSRVEAIGCMIWRRRCAPVTHVQPWVPRAGGRRNGSHPFPKERCHQPKLVTLRVQ